MSRKIDSVSEQLGVACSVTAFESTEFHRFQDDLTLSLQKAVQAAVRLCEGTVQSNWVRYDNQKLEAMLFGGSAGIRWTELAAQYNRVTAARCCSTVFEKTNNRSLPCHATPLEAILMTLQDPKVVPMACQATVLVILFRLLVELPSIGIGTPAHGVLVESMNRLLSRSAGSSPSVVASFWESMLYHVQFWYGRSSLLVHYDVERTNRIIRVLQLLAKRTSCSGVGGGGGTVLQCLLLLVQHLDDADVLLLQKNQTRTRSKPCRYCEHNAHHPKRKRRKVKAATLEQLHEESHERDSEEDAMNDAAPTREDDGWVAESIDNINSQTPFICDYCQMHTAIASTSRASEITQLSPPLVFLRSRLLQKFLSISSTIMQSRPQLQSPAAAHERPFRSTTGRHDGDSSALGPIVQLACRFPNSPSLRLGLVLLADTLSSRGYHLVIHLLWDLYDHRSSIAAEHVLRVYAEVVVQCSQFDDPSHCWEAMQPLARALLQSRTTDDTILANVRTRLLLRCFSCILISRLCQLSPSGNSVVHQEMQQLVARLALSFGEAGWWIYPQMSIDERDEILHAMRAVGLLGLTDEACSSNDQDSSCEESHPSANDTAKCYLHWPFPNHLSLRLAYQRAGPKLGRPGMLSDPSDWKIATDLESSSSFSPQHNDERLVGVPIMDHLNDDVLRIVFSFLGYKRLVRVTSVCKHWKTLALEDDLWRQSYHARFRIPERDATLADELSRGGVCDKSTSWKRLFVDKYLAERDIRFKRNASGWRHRTCNRLGCLMVLKSASQMKRHAPVHEKKSNRRSKER